MKIDEGVTGKKSGKVEQMWNSKAKITIEEYKVWNVRCVYRNSNWWQMIKRW